MKETDLNICETELKKRWELPYEWGRKQNDHWDRHSNFVYETTSWESLKKKSSEVSQKQDLPQKDFLNYSANRWYNFHSAMAVESVFSVLPGVQSNFDKKNRLIDFTLCGIDFDHKTSIYPRNFKKNLLCARKNPQVLVNWLYENQSSQGRKHHSNRLFLIVFSEDGEHWKLKAEITWFKGIIEKYVSSFDKEQLIKIEFQPGEFSLSDIIWAVK